MEMSNSFSFSKCAPQISNSGQYIAYISYSRLIIRNSATLALKESVDLPKEFAQKIIGIKWDKCIVGGGNEDRLLVFTADEIRTYSIENHSGGAFHIGAIILPGKHPIVNVEWMSMLYKHDDETSQYVRIIAFAISGLSCSIWTSDGIELEFSNPKRSNLIQHGDHFALVTRQGTSDIVYDLEFNQCVLYDSYKLSGMIDIKEIKWSPSNKWVAAIDSPVLGYKVGIWTVDGSHINTYYGPDNKVLERGGLGASVIFWSPIDYKGRDVLLIGDFSERLVILDTLNFRPISIVSHGDVFQQECCIWEETVSDDEIKYVLKSPPLYLPELDNTTISSNDVGQGVIMLDVSPSGKHIATVVRTAPKFVWIWFAVDFKKPILTAVLSHTGSVREIKWNNTGQNLMISFFSVHRDYVSVWNSTVQTPKLLNPDAVDLQLRGIQWIPNHNSVLMWTSDEFMVSPLTEDGAGVNTSIMDIDLNKNFQNDDLDRGGSPQHLQDDNTVVRDLVNGVQQQEWGDPGNYQLEDTFHKMNIKK